MRRLGFDLDEGTSALAAAAALAALHAMPVRWHAAVREYRLT